MNFEFSEEQSMLRDSVARFIQDNYDFDTRRLIADSANAMNNNYWQQFAELGWLSVPFAETFGGFGGNAVDIMLVMEEFGKGLVLEPYLPTVVLFGGLLQKCGSAALQEQWLPRIIDGSCQGALAATERQSRYEFTDIATTATADGDAFILNGEKVVVLNGYNADQLIVAARTAGEQSETHGISLFLLAADSAGVERLGYRMMDGQLVANIIFDKVSVPASQLLGELHGGHDLLKSALLDAKLALAAEAVGIMETLNAKTLEYTKTRKQFGVPIGSFQALQHRMVDTFMACEQTRSLLYRAVCAVTDQQEDAESEVHALAVMVARAGKLIGAEATQLHGGMGLTDELDVTHYAKRLMMINATFGNGDYHQAKFNALRYSA
jgi:alkylation response protein AidB-like acyl-CoA dehydrogenase